MSLNDTVGQQLPDEHDEREPTRVERAVRALDASRPAIHRWFWKGLLAFNLILASLVFWLSVVPTYL